MSAPLLLIHYGNSSYLPYVIKVAKRFNPDKEIIFLGDEHNQYVAYLGVSHHRFAPLRHSPELKEFDALYPRIANPKYPKSRWARFVLQRWFMINTFIEQHDITRFWTFDTDNYILTDLSNHEIRLSRYDCTSQCGGNCLNGFVSSQSLVQRYIKTINELLSDDQYVRDWHTRYQENPTLFYNEMDGFSDFVKRDGIDNFHLAQIHDGSMFDDTITYDNGMEMLDTTLKGRRVKKLYMQNDKIYCKQIASGSFVRMNNLNLSWMPKYIFPLLFKYFSSPSSDDSFVELDLLKAPWSYHVKLFIRDQIPKPVRDRISRGAYWV